jgi:hypothetical protein
MADLRISELAALAGVDLAASDLLAVVDSSASETKRSQWSTWWVMPPR